MDLEAFYLNENTLNQIKEKIKNEGIYKDGATSWYAVISPDGKIILPTEDAPEHLEMAEKLIYPNDMVLRMLFEYFCPDSQEDISNIDKEIFMTLGGYIELKGTNLQGTEKPQCTYNPAALDDYRVIIARNLNDFCEVVNFLDEEHTSKTLMERAKKVAFFRKKIVDKLIARRLGINQIDELLEEIKQSESALLSDIEKEYEKIQASNEEQNQAK